MSELNAVLKVLLRIFSLFAGSTFYLRFDAVVLVFGVKNISVIVLSLFTC